MKAFRPSVYGQVVLLIWAVAMAVVLPTWHAAWVLGALGLVRALLPPPEGAPSGPWGRKVMLLVALLALPVLLSSLAAGDRWLALALGFQTALRAVTVMAAAHIFASSVSVAELTALFEGIGLRGLGFALGVAFNLLPTVQETARNAYHAMRLRGASRRPGLRPLRLWLVTVIVGTLRHGEEIVAAAEARAFDPAGPGRIGAPRLVRADAVAVGLVLLTTAAALIW